MEGGDVRLPVLVGEVKYETEPVSVKMGRQPSTRKRKPNKKLVGDEWVRVVTGTAGL
jgi:hypothetical protein